MGRWQFDADGLAASFQIGGLVDARREPEEMATALGEGADLSKAGQDLFLLTTARVEGAIATEFEDVRRVEDLRLEAKGEGTSLLRSGPQQTVATEDGRTIVRLGAAHGVPDEASAEEVAEGLAETVDYPTNDARVVATARDAVGDAKTPREKVERLVKFVGRYLKDEPCPKAVPVVQLLDRKSGDCSEHAELFTTLARAAGIPTREVSGLMYMGDEIAAFGGHAWNEVALDGRWVPVDATHEETVVDATHLALGREGRELDFASAAGRLSFVVISVTPAPSPKKADEGK
jgi:transglutaminase-like putative cysteine protease